MTVKSGLNYSQENSFHKDENLRFDFIHYSPQTIMKTKGTLGHKIDLQFMICSVQNFADKILEVCIYMYL